MLKAGIISIGDEILIGQIVNTNSAYLAEKLTNFGYKVIAVSTVGDEEADLINELDFLLPKCDLIITTGGLGPTHDDITKPILCKYLDDELIRSKQWEDKLEVQFANRGIELSQRNKDQALIPKRSKILYNQIGTAPGLLSEINGKYIISLPGVPSEMTNIIEEAASEFLKHLSEKGGGDTILYKNLIMFGIPESHLADLLDIDEAFLGKSTLAFLPSFRGIKLRIGAYGINKFEAEKELKRIADYIINKANKYLISENNESITETAHKLLTDNKFTISVAESCTGGLLAGELTSLSGSSNYMMGGIVAYSNEIKENICRVKKETLMNFGAVSKETALELAINTREIFKTDFALSITGIAGPGGGTEFKPVGTVWLGISSEKFNDAFLYKLGDDRDINRRRAVTAALALLINTIRENMGIYQ